MSGECYCLFSLSLRRIQMRVRVSVFTGNNNKHKIKKSITSLSLRRIQMRPQFVRSRHTPHITHSTSHPEFRISSEFQNQQPCQKSSAPIVMSVCQCTINFIAI